jgi:hypothetical protein
MGLQSSIIQGIGYIIFISLLSSQRVFGDDITLLLSCVGLFGDGITLLPSCVGLFGDDITLLPSRVGLHHRLLRILEISKNHNVSDCCTLRLQLKRVTPTLLYPVDRHVPDLWSTGCAHCAGPRCGTVCPSVRLCARLQTSVGYKHDF